jgi:hypothetical protein
LIEGVLCLCAERVVRDAERNSVSLIDLIEILQPARYPAVLPTFTALGVFERAAADASAVELVLSIRQDSDELLRFPFSIDFQNARRTRAITHVEACTVPRAGACRTAFLLGDRELCGYTFHLLPPKD